MTVSKVRPRSPRLSASAASNRAVRPRSAALRRARSMARGEMSTPTASAPRAAASSACSPLPQPASSTRPPSRPLSARRTNAGCGRPMSHGARAPASYAESQPACGVVMVPPHLDGRDCCLCISCPPACSDPQKQIPSDPAAAGTRAGAAPLAAAGRRSAGDGAGMGEAWTRLSAGTGSGRCSRGGRWWYRSCPPGPAGYWPMWPVSWRAVMTRRCAPGPSTRRCSTCCWPMSRLLRRRS